MATATRKPQYTIGVDVGGTKIYALIVNSQGKIISNGKKMTQAEKGPKVVIERVIKTMDEALANAKLTPAAINAIGIGLPGMVDDVRGVAIGASNMKGFVNVPVAKQLQKWRNVPVTLLNDVNAAAVAEHTIGAAKGVKNFVTVFLGTGVGGGIYVDGKLVVGGRNSAGEIGHSIVLPDGPYTSPIAVRGGIETLASRTAIERDLRVGLANGRSSVLTQLLAQKDGEFSSSVLALALRKKDALTIEVLRRAAYYLGLHLSQLINILDPEMFVFGGGVIEAVGDFVIPIAREVAMQNVVYKKGVEKIKFVRSKFGDDAGALGCAMGAHQKLQRR